MSSKPSNPEHNNISKTQKKQYRVLVEEDNGTIKATPLHEQPCTRKEKTDKMKALRLEMAELRDGTKDAVE